MARARIPIRMTPPTVYVVGQDITTVQYADLIQKVGDWFAEWRNTKEPVALARTTIDRALQGLKPKDATPWYEMATASLNARIRSACRFDMDSMEPIRKGSEKVQLKKARIKEKKARDQMARREDPNIPDEIRQDLKSTAKYGDNPHVFLSSEEAKRWKELFDAYVSEFPELSTINGQQELSLLCDLMVHLERQRFKLLKGDKASPADPTDITNITKQITDLKKAMGISPDQVAKRVKEDSTTSVGAAISKFEAGEDFRLVRAKYWLEEMLQAYQMYNTLRADGSGYQLDDAGLFSLTRCRTCHCASCGTRNFSGFKVEEIEAHLIAHGGMELIEVPVAEVPTTPMAYEDVGAA
jgi:hypothetical protein